MRIEGIAIPVRVDEDGDIMGADGVCVAQSHGDTEAGAMKYISEAVNYHDRLVEALKLAIEWNGAGLGMTTCDIEDAQALLAELSAHNGGEG